MTEYQADTIRVAKLSCIVLPNGEILCGGESIGFMDNKRPSFSDRSRKLGEYIEFLEEGPAE